MRLHGLCYYRSKSDEWTNGWRNVDYAARNLVKAIKHSDFRGSSKLTINGTNYTIDNTAEGRARALAICAGALASKITQAGYAQVAPDAAFQKQFRLRTPVLFQHQYCILIPRYQRLLEAVAHAMPTQFRAIFA